MLIQCTKKLLDELKINLELEVEEEPLYSWHANLIKIDRKKAVVLVNDKTRYIIVLYGLKSKDFKMLDELIIQAISKTFQAESIKDEIIETFINQSKNITYTKTKDRSTVAKMNKACDNIYYFYKLLNHDSIFQTELSVEASDDLFGDGKNQYIRPNEELFKALEAFTEGPVLKTNAVQIKVTLELENHNVWRRLIVPIHMEFNKFHKVLQRVFGWMDYHLHEFYIYDDKGAPIKLSINHSAFHEKGFKPIINIVSHSEVFEYKNDVSMELEKGKRLSEYVPKYKHLKYNYDFGDNWQHFIEVEKFIENYDKNHPMCLEGEGNTPPEDVGGEYGYEEFLEILADKNHAEHKEIASWGRMQGYKDFDIEAINWILKHIKSY